MVKETRYVCRMCGQFIINEFGKQPPKNTTICKVDDRVMSLCPECTLLVRECIKK